MRNAKNKPEGNCGTVVASSLNLLYYVTAARLAVHKRVRAEGRFFGAR